MADKTKAKDNTSSVLARNTKQKDLKPHHKDPSLYGTSYIPEYDGQPLTIANIYAMSDEERELVAKYLFDYFRKGGFPYPKFSKEELVRDYQSLVELNTEEVWADKVQGIISCGNIRGNKIFKHYNEHFFDCKEDKKMVSVRSVFDDDEKLMKVIRNRLGITFIYRGVNHPFDISGNMLRQGIRSMRLAPQTSNFRPAIAKLIYDTYCKDGDIVWDYSSGFNQRLLGAMASKHEIKYVGTDPWKATVLAGKKIIQDFDFGDHAKILNCGSESSKILALKDSVSLVFSSPPYYSKEVYSDDESQAYSGGYESFLQDYWKKTCENAKEVLVDDGVFILNMSRKHKKLNLLQDMIEIVEDVGFVEVERLHMKFSKSHLSGKVGGEELMKMEPIVVFRKK